MIIFHIYSLDDDDDLYNGEVCVCVSVCLSRFFLIFFGLNLIFQTDLPPLVGNFGKQVGKLFGLVGKLFLQVGKLFSHVGKLFLQVGKLF